MSSSTASSRFTGSNFTALRLFAVVLVIYGNGLVLTGAPASGLWGAPFPRIGLDLLFAVSGYLAAGSWDRLPRLAPYLTKRALRLFPGLAACVLATILVIGPLATRLSLKDYLLDAHTRQYLGNILLVQQLWLPGVFEGQPWVGTVNPMLWTLVPGAACCLLVPLLGQAPLRFRAGVTAGSAAIFAVAAFVMQMEDVKPPPLLFRVSLVDMLTEIPFFLLGAWLAMLEQRRGESLWRPDLAMLCFAANWGVASWLGSWTIVLEWLTLPYMAVCFGRMHMPLLRRLAPLGNPSFGFFLYAFPIQQLIVARLPGNPHPILLCMALALGAGLLSWRLVERPALLWFAGLRPRVGQPSLRGVK